LRNFKPAAGWLGVCACFVGGFEGLSCTAYPDRLAHNLPTVCYGETEGVKLGDHYTKEQCRDMLAAKLPRYWSEIAACIRVPVSDNEKVAYTSFSYNVGTGAFCKSKMAHNLNLGHHKEACAGLLAYDHASGRKVAGLTRRREAERKLCLTPDTEKTDADLSDLAPTVPTVVVPSGVVSSPAVPEPRLRRWLHWLLAKLGLKLNIAAPLSGAIGH
jgi:lysozyme